MDDAAPARRGSGLAPALSAETIFAVASGPGRGAVAVLRISGDQAGDMVRALAGTLPPARRLSLRRLRDPAGMVIDDALVAWMPGPGSYTGEDSAELHVHAGPAVIDGVASSLIAAGARPAEAGEFTRRAFLHGRMGLTEAEAVADLIAAETAAQRTQALRQLHGGLGGLVDGWTQRLRQILARQEARIDFPDETGAEPRPGHPDGTEISRLIADLDDALSDEHAGEHMRDGLTFVVTGPANVGKSSLVNALAGRPAAIVADRPGTTRDVLEVRTRFGDVPVTLVDTAGLQDSDDPVELEGMRRARAQIAQAQLVLSVAQAGQMEKPAAPSRPEHTLLLSSKIDLAPGEPGRLGFSVVTGTGMTPLRMALDDAARRLTRTSAGAPLTRARHRAACLQARAHLRLALTMAAEELAAEELRLAMAALGRVTGRVGVEDVLDEVFSQFCIGK